MKVTSGAQSTLVVSTVKSAVRRRGSRATSPSPANGRCGDGLESFAGGDHFGRIHSATPTKGTYDAALTTKHAVAPKLAIKMPAIYGPRTRDRLNWIE